jgi:hypothetical protein
MTFLYIDPGTGMILIQLIVAGFTAALVFFKKIKTSLSNFFKKKDNEN